MMDEELRERVDAIERKQRTVEERLAGVRIFLRWTAFMVALLAGILALSRAIGGV